MTSGQQSNEDSEKYRQEGREEVLDWLLREGLIQYSSWDKFYFIYNRFTEILIQLPWKKHE